MKKLLYETSVFIIYAINTSIMLYVKGRMDDYLFLSFDYKHLDLEHVFSLKFNPDDTVDGMSFGPSIKTHPILKKIFTYFQNRTDRDPINEYKGAVLSHNFNNKSTKDDNNKFKTIFAPYFENNTYAIKHGFTQNTSDNFFYFIVYLQLLYLYYSTYLKPINISNSATKIDFKQNELNKYLAQGLVNINPLNNEALIQLKEAQSQAYYNNNTKWVPWDDYIIKNNTTNSNSKSSATSFLFGLQNEYNIRWDMNDVILNYNENGLILSSLSTLADSYIMESKIDTVASLLDILQCTSFLSMYKMLINRRFEQRYSTNINLDALTLNTTINPLSEEQTLYLHLSSKRRNLTTDDGFLHPYDWTLYLQKDFVLTKTDQLNLYLKIMNQGLLQEIMHNNDLDFYTCLVIMESFKLVLEHSLQDTTITMRNILCQGSNDLKLNNDVLTYDILKQKHKNFQQKLYHCLAAVCIEIIREIRYKENNSTKKTSVNVEQSVLYQAIQDDNLKTMLNNYCVLIEDTLKTQTNIFKDEDPYYVDFSMRAPEDLFTPNLCNYLALLELNDVKLTEWLKDRIITSINPRLISRLDFNKIINSSQINQIVTKPIKKDKPEDEWFKSSSLR